MADVFFRVADGVLVESLGESVVVYVPGSQHALHLEGDVADALRCVSGHGVLSREHCDAAGALVEMGVVVPSHVQEQAGIGRRPLLLGASAAAASAIAALSLPSVAAASSEVVLQGDWRISGGPIFFRLSRTTYSFLPQVAFDMDLEEFNYSRLTIGGQSVPVYPPMDPTLPEVEWADAATNFPGLTGAITGTFTVDNQDYTAIFTPA